MMKLLLCFAAVLALVHADAFLRFSEPARARKRLLKENPIHRVGKSAVGCKGCVDFFDANLNTILNLILQVGIGGTCQDLCSKLPNTIEATVCTLLCLVGGMEKFVNALQGDDLDPVYICAVLDACKNNTCTGPCTTVVDAQAVPSSAPLRSKFMFHISIKANENTGVGTTAMTWPCTGQQCQEQDYQIEIINDGFTKGSVTNVEFEVNTEEDDWLFPVGTHPVTVFSCGSGCVNPHGTIFSNGYTNFTITPRVAAAVDVEH